MNRTTTFLVAALAACSTNTDLTNRPLYDNGVNVFEAQVVDGVTGATVAGATISVQIGRHTLDATDDNGFFSVYGIPYGTFRVSASAMGYSPFQAMKSFTSSNPSDSLSDGDPLVYYFNNIVMYPEGTVPQGITVSVFDGATGNPQPGATVVAALTGVGTPIPVSNALLPNVGLRPFTLNAATDAAGKVMFMAESLVIGGAYEIDVFGALDANGVYLVPTQNQSVTVGLDLQEVLVFLSRPFLSPVALRVNNENPTMSVPNLKVTFPYAIEVCSMSASHNWSNVTFPIDTNSNGVFAQPATTNRVTHSLGANDTELTLQHNLQSGTDDPLDDLRVNFSGVSVRPKGASASSCTPLANVRLRCTSCGTLVNTTIQVRDV